MEKRDYLICLYDIYSELFNEKQRKYFEDYYFNNLSLGEIADNLNISRNAVHKSIKSIEEKLIFYEKTLAIYELNKKINELMLVDDIEYLKKELERIIN